MPPRGLRLLVAVDFSPQSLRALREAREILERAGGALTVIHVRPHSDVRAAVLEERGDLLKRPEGALRKEIAAHYESRLSLLVRPARKESWKLRRGKPAVEICREARRGYDLIVAASRGGGAATRLLLGSTVQELLTGSPIPVVVLPQ